MPPTSGTARTWAAVLLAASLACAQDRPPQPQQPQPQPQTEPQGPIDPLSLDGRGFAGLTLPMAGAVDADAVELAGRRAWAWEHTPPGGGAPTRRLAVVGDVRVAVGGLELTADAAHGWLAPLTGEGRQFFLVLEGASMPAGGAGVGVSGPIVPIEGRLGPGAPVRLSAILMEDGPAPQGVTAAARGAFVDRLRELAGLARRRQASAAGGAAERDAVARVLEQADRRLGALPTREPILPGRGRVSFAAGRIEQVRLDSGAGGRAAAGDPQAGVGEPRYALVLGGPVVIQFSDVRGGRRAQLSARSAVVFHDADTTPGGRLDAADVRGVYLEGDVAADIEASRGPDTERYRVRAPRAYYDLRNDRAVLLEAVFRIEPAGSPTPLYVRADEIRQRSLRVATARGARLTTTGFFRPHLALGASSVTLRAPEPGDRRTIIADARGLTVRVQDAPLAYWPRYVGDPTRIPLRDLRVESSSASGLAVRTAWDGFSLAGVEPPAGLDLDVLIDTFFERGPALGGELRWSGPRGSGELFVYNLFEDGGTDQLATGARVDRDGDNRTIALLEHMARLDDRWTLRAEGAFFSDQNVADALGEGITDARREPVTGLSVQRTGQAGVLTLSAELLTNDFLVTEHALRSRGFLTERLPEARLTRTGDDLLPDARPGLLTYTSDSRVGLLRPNFTEPTAAELGFTTPRRSRAGLGIEPDQAIADRLRDRGLSERSIFRADSQHGLSAQLRLGALRVQPFVTGRVTAYDTQHAGFDDDADAGRLWGAAGLRADTELTRVYDGLSVPWLDLHRLRHSVRPGATLWAAGATVPQGALPVLDEEVENLAQGPAARVGVDQTFSTMRGGAGRMASVDVLELSSHLVIAGDERPDPDRVPRFFEAFPERSQLGDALELQARLRPTDALGLTLEHTHDLDRWRAAETVAGFEIDHTPTTRFFGEYRRLGAADDTFLTAGTTYRLSERYEVGLRGVYDGGRGGFQSLAVSVARTIPHLIVTGQVRYNDITSETSLGLAVQPTLNDPRRDRLERLGVDAF